MKALMIKPTQCSQTEWDFHRAGEGCSTTPQRQSSSWVSALSSRTFLGYSTWKKPEDLFLYQGNVILFLISSHCKTQPFLSKFPGTFPSAAGVVFLSFSSFSPRKSKWYALSCSPGLPYQLFGISVGQHRLSWEKGSGEVMWGLWCWMTACDEMRPTQTAMIESSCKVERFWWLKRWLSAEEILLPLSSQ